MGLFSSPEKSSYLGLDVGYGGMKLVELRNEKGRARLVTYAYVNMPSDSLDKSMLNDPAGSAEILKQMLTKARATTKRVAAALPLSSVFSTVLSVPSVEEKEVKDLAFAQVKKLLPWPIEEAAVDLKVIDKVEKSEATKASTRVLVSAAPKSLVTKYTELFKLAGLEAVALETEGFAEIRALIGKDKSTIMLLDLGSLRTNVMVVEKGVPFVIRSIGTGGNAISQTIARTLGIPLDQAETMKRDIKSMQSFTPTGDLRPILGVLVKPILEEVRYSINLYQSQDAESANKRIEKIILTGGSSLLPRLSEYLTQELNINTYLGDPWARVVYPADLRPVLDELGPRYAVAIGCAMREVDG